VEIAYPVRLDGQGRTALTDEDRHVRDLIEVLLLTAPGERVNRPDFGTGLLQMLFLPNAEPLAAATEAAVNGELARAFAGRIEVRGVDVVVDESLLRVAVRYVRRSGEPERTVVVTKAAP
jgi:phage baseplate assembly protein W